MSEAISEASQDKVISEASEGKAISEASKVKAISEAISEASEGEAISDASEGKAIFEATKGEENARLGVVTEKGVYFDLLIEKSDHELLTNDKELTNAASILEKYLDKVQGIPFHNDSCQSLKLEGWGLKPFVSFRANSQGKLVRIREIEKFMEDEELISSGWDEVSTYILIQLVGEKREKLSDPHVRKKFVWREISAQMKEQGLLFSAHNVSKKWQNLKDRYVRVNKAFAINESKASHLRKKVVSRWQYYKAVKNALLGIPSVNKVETMVRHEGVTNPELRHAPASVADHNQSETEGQNSNITEHREAIQADVFPENDEELGPTGWNSRSVFLLIRLMGERYAKPGIREAGKKVFWMEISARLMEQGFFFSQAAVNKKWSNLKHRYTQLSRILANDVHKDDPVRRKVAKWEYFQAMKDALQGTLFADKADPQEEITSPELRDAPVPVADHNQTEGHNSNITEEGEVFTESAGQGRIIAGDTSQVESIAWNSTDEPARDLEPIGRVNGVDSCPRKEIPSEDVQELEESESLEEMDCGEDMDTIQQSAGKNEAQNAGTSSSKKKKRWLSEVPVEYRGVVRAMRRESRKTRKVMKELIKQQQRSALLFEQFLSKLSVADSNTQERQTL